MKKLFLVFTLFFLLNGNLTFAESPQDPCGEGVDCYRIELRESLIPDKNPTTGRTGDIITGRTGMELTKNYITLIYTYGASLIGIICVLLIVFSGIQIITGGADAENVTQAKTRIFNSLLSLVLLFMSAMILKSINPGFFRHGRDSSNIIIGLDGEAIPIAPLCKFAEIIPPSCYTNGKRADNCKAEGTDLCIALNQDEEKTNCVKILQGLLSGAGSFNEIDACNGLTNFEDGAYGDCTFAAFTAWETKYCDTK